MNQILRLTWRWSVGVIAAPAFLLLFMPVLGSTLSAQSRRIAGEVNDSRRLVLTGHRHPAIRPEYDQGSVDPLLNLSITLDLNKSAAQQSELDELLRRQQDPASPLFRKWLRPEEYAGRFGLSQEDVDKIVGWLKASGFTGIRAATGRDFIIFHGTAIQVQAALRTPIHRYIVDGEVHYANAAEPSVPEAIAPVVAGFLGLDDFRPRHPKNSVRRVPFLHRRSEPNVTDPQSGISALTPNDLAAIYDMNPLYQNGFDGTGQTLVVVGQTNVDLGDIRAFRQGFGLPSNDPQMILVPNKGDPGVGSDEDVLEADLDLEWSGAVARNAAILFVYSRNAFDAAQYAIDQALAPVISFSFGSCEASATPARLQIDRAMAQKANAEGITWVASSGDSGAAACENQSATATQATTGLAVNLPASIPEVLAVGGTEFAEGQGAYWGTNDSSGASALGYIPETAWNDSGLITSGFAAGGGGVSLAYPKPWWQSGPGVPKDGFRDVPDVALTASSAHDPYVFVSGGQIGLVGGTSAAAPALAGIVLLLNQYLGAPGLGNITPNLYALAQGVPATFHDITAGDNKVPCQPGSPNCRNGFLGYNAGFGYDQVTGLGSVDASQVITNWTALPSLAITALSSDTSGLAGNKITVSVTVTNIGGAGAGAFRIGGFLSPSSTDLSSAVGLFSCDFSGLAVGVTTTCAGPVTVPGGMQAGKYYLVAIGDVQNQLVEYYLSHSVKISDSGTVAIAVPCSYSLNVSSSQFPGIGGTGSLTIHTQAGCPWSVSSNASWILLASASAGSGTGSVAFSVATNTGPARSGTINMANQQFTISQAAAAPFCSYALSSPGNQFPSTGGSGTFTVQTQAGCSWIPVPTASWIGITGATAGTGTGAVLFAVAANTGPARVGTVSVANLQFTISQAAGATQCSYSLPTSSAAFGSGGGTGTFAVQTQAGCTWTATSSANWIGITSAPGGTGTAVVAFVVTANSGSGRVGTINVADQQFTVSQSAASNINLQFTNYLIYPATVSVNGSPIGVVNASGTALFATPPVPTLIVSFELIRPTVSGLPIGDPMIGYWTLTNPAGSYNLTISNQIGTQEYFAPVITNLTGGPLLMDVNIGLAAENRCNCVVPVSASNVGIGYYQFFSNSTVDAFPGSIYAGTYSYFNNLGGFVQAQTGVTSLTFR